MKKILCLTLVLLSLCGCMESVQLNGRAVVQAVAIDRTAGGYRVTLQLGEVTETAAGKTGGVGAFLSETGGTLTEAFSRAAVTQGKQIFMGNCSLLLIGESTARGGIDEILRYFNAIHRVNPSINVALTREDAGEVLRAREQNPLLSAEGITEQLVGAWQGGFSVRGRLIDTISALQSDQAAACLPLLTLEKERESAPPPEESAPVTVEAAVSPRSEEGVPRLRIVGAGVFRGEYLDRVIDLRAVRGYAWTQNRIKSTSLVVDDDRLGQISAVTNAQKATSSVEAVGDLLVFNIDLKVRCTVLEEKMLGGSTPEQMEIAVMLQERQLQEEIEHMLEETQRRGYDLLELSLLVRQRFPDFYEAHRDNWGEVLRGSGYNVRVQCALERTGVARLDLPQ